MYVKLENNVPLRWPVVEYEIRAEFPEVSLPTYLTADVIEPLGYAPFVVCGYPSDYNPQWQEIKEVAPVLKEDGKYHQTYEITEIYSPEEKQQLLEKQAKADNKDRAESLLAASDWSDKPSVTDTTKPLHLVNAAEWEAYRDALRVIAVVPSVTVEWPVKPEEVWSV